MPRQKSRLVLSEKRRKRWHNDRARPGSHRPSPRRRAAPSPIDDAAPMSTIVRARGLAASPATRLVQARGMTMSRSARALTMTKPKAIVARSVPGIHARDTHPRRAPPAASTAIASPSRHRSPRDPPRPTVPGHRRPSRHRPITNRVSSNPPRCHPTRSTTRWWSSPVA